MSRQRRGIGLGRWMRRRRRRGDDLAAICRDLRLDGWEHLANLEAAVLLTPGGPAAQTADWQLVARLVAAWAGPLTLLDPGSPVSPQRLAELGVQGPADPSEAAERLRRGEKILVLSSETSAGAPRQPEGEAVRLWIRLHAPEGGRRRLEVRPAGTVASPAD